MSELEAKVANVEQKVKIILALIDVADRASISFQLRDYEATFKALDDYHALRNEHSDIPFVV